MTFANGSVEMVAVAPSQPLSDLSVKVSVSLVCAGVHQEVGDEVGLTVGDGIGAGVVTTDGAQLSSEISSSSLHERIPCERAPLERPARERPARERRLRSRG